MASSGGAERREAFRRGVSLLGKAGIANPALDAAVLLAHVTGEDAATALIERHKVLTAGERSLYETLIKRRCRHETVSRITGGKEFYSRSFQTNKDVLDPRPETEILVERALHRLECLSWSPKVLDIGTGSGVIAVTIAAENPLAVITATDISPAALRTASANSARHGVSDRIRFAQMDLATGLADVDRFDLVISNPPYVSQAEYRTLAPEVLKCDPATALLAGPEGTEFHSALAEAAKRLLKPGGHLLVEVGAGQGDRVETLFRASGFGRITIYKDLAGIPRVVEGRKSDG